MARPRPGTERARDEQRRGGGPRYHGERWHDADAARTEGPEMAELDAVEEVASVATTEGMGIVHARRGANRAEPPPGSVRALSKKKKRVRIPKAPKAAKPHGGGARSGA